MKFALFTLFALALAFGAEASILPWGGVVTQVAGWPWGGAWVSPVPAAVPIIGGHASYVAQTRGAVHTAPLEGHINSVANVNIAPAPGTW